MNANPLSAAYGAVVGARNAFYDRGWLKSHRLQGPVISVGNLSAGGTGKTPFVILLGELLKARGIKFDVLSRGYGRRSKGVRLVDPAGLPQEFGDEPLLIARRLQAPVIVGKDRYQAGLCAESKFGPRLHLLDDGFQHRALARDFDIVLVTPKDASDRLLPAGRLREPLKSLRRADAVVLASGASAESFPIDKKMVWRVRRGIDLKNLTAAPIGTSADLLIGETVVAVGKGPEGIDLSPADMERRLTDALGVYVDAMRYSREDLTICNALSDAGWLAGVGVKRGVGCVPGAQLKAGIALQCLRNGDVQSV